MSAISASARGWIIVSLIATVPAIGHVHAVGEEAEVRLVHAQHVLHRSAGDADLLADHPLARALAPREDAERDGVGIVDRKVEVARAQRSDRMPLHQRLVQLLGQGLVQGAAGARLSF